MIALGSRLPLLVLALIPVAAVIAEVRQSWVLGVSVLGLAVVVPTVVDGFRAGSPTSVVVSRDLPSSVVMGSSSTITWKVVNQADRRRSIRIADDFAPSLGAERRAHLRLPALGVGDVHIPFVPTRRGLFTPSRITVRVDGPWGLMSRQGERVQPAEMRVVPVFRSKREIELRLHRARLLEIGSRSVRARGGGTEFDHLREFGVDDSYRHIDWSATARTGHPIVRSYRAEEHRSVVVMLDNGRMMAARSGGVTRLEHAMDAVMALATVSSRVGDKLGLVTFDREPHRIVAPGRGRRQMSHLTETIFALEPVLSESDYDLAATTVLARFRRRVLVVLLTDLVNPVVEASIAPAVKALTTRHQVVVGAVTNSEVADWSRRLPTGVTEAYETGSALSSIDERVEASRRLRSIGAAVIDVEAGRLGPSLVDHYLETKARGL